MGNWYRVVKTIKGHRYVYLQQTYRQGEHINRNNCSAQAKEMITYQNSKAGLPHKFKFGEAYVLNTGDCNPIEVTVVTDRGSSAPR